MSQLLRVPLLVLVFLFSVQASAQSTITVTVNGTIYELTTTPGPVTYNSNTSLLQGQPWWGNSALAEALAAQMQYQLGDLQGGPGSDSGIPSALLAYGVIGNDVSIVYWDGAVQNCPDGCPSVDGDYVWVLGRVAGAASPVPVMPLVGVGLMILGMLAVARRRFVRR